MAAGKDVGSSGPPDCRQCGAGLTWREYNGRRSDHETGLCWCCRRTNDEKAARADGRLGNDEWIPGVTHDIDGNRW